jgi:cytidylate kinase
MNLIIVSGPEATCKTFIGRAIAESLGYEYQSKDTIKEAMFDTARHSTWDYRWYETKAKQDFFRQIDQFIKNDTDIVIESNFIGEDRANLQACLHSGITVREIYCYTKGMTTLKRFVARNESGKRHAGHHDRRWYPKIMLEDLLQYVGVRWPSKPSGLGSTLLEVNTTDFTKIDTQEIISSLGIK